MGEGLVGQGMPRGESDTPGLVGQGGSDSPGLVGQGGSDFPGLVGQGGSDSPGSVGQGGSDTPGLVGLLNEVRDTHTHIPTPHHNTCMCTHIMYMYVCNTETLCRWCGDVE